MLRLLHNISRRSVAANNDLDNLARDLSDVCNANALARFVVCAVFCFWVWSAAVGDVYGVALGQHLLMTSKNLLLDDLL